MTRKAHLLLHPSAFEKFMNHTAALWSGGPGKELTERDYTVMALGLPGEFGELVEELQRPALHREDFVKEAGDTVYYLGRIAHAFAISAKDLLSPAQPLPSLILASNEGVALQAVRGIGQVCEAMKKRTRDGFADEQARLRFENKLRCGLALALQAWLELLNRANVAPSEVLETNLAKLHDRRQRGTLQGDGNHR
mgnify:CR=1 FL=1|jgi:hypothetical protein